MQKNTMADNRLRRSVRRAAGRESTLRVSRIVFNLSAMPQTVVGVVIMLAAASVIVYGRALWESGTRGLRARLESARAPIRPKVFD